MSKPMVEKVNGRLVVELEAIESFLERCEKLEIAVEQIRDILQSKEFDQALLDGYEPKNPASDVIIQNLLIIKQVVAKIL